MENTTLKLIVAKSLPALSGESITYNAARNMFLTMGYTCLAGNTYFRAIQLSNRLIVYYDIGVGDIHTFLNGIKLFCWDGKKASLIAQKYWGGCNWRCFNEQFAKEESIDMLKNFLAGQMKLEGTYVSDQDLLTFSRNMVEETQR